MSEKSKVRHKVETISLAIGVMVTLQTIASPFIMGYLRDAYRVELDSFNANTKFRNDHIENKKLLDATINNVFKRVEILESSRTTTSVGLRVRNEDNTLWYRDAKRMLYNAYYLPTYGAYFYMDSEGREWECH